MDIVKEKIKQAGQVLEDLGVDLWLVMVRETAMQSDPVLPLVVGADVTWLSFFAYTRDGEAIALVGNLDVAEFERHDRFTEVLTYVAGVKEDFRKLIARLDPKQIALNYSADNPAADGLTHGMYLELCNFLKPTDYADRLISAEPICNQLRSIKTSSEIDCLSRAAVMADQIWQVVSPRFKVGMTEIEVGQVIDAEIRTRGGEPSFETIVNAGDKTSPGHGHPTPAKLEAGDLLHVDFGVRLDDYCSDIQRLLYFQRPNELRPPAELTDAFDMVASIITETAQRCRPGVKGYEVDSLARNMLRENGYNEYEHALGHQLGRAVHDGGALLGPKWERYGGSPSILLAEHNVFTLELEINLPGIGCVGLEEDIIVTPNGGRFLGPRQLELGLL